VQSGVQERAIKVAKCINTSERALEAMSALTEALIDEMPKWQWLCLRARVQLSLQAEAAGVEDDELVAGRVRHLIAELERLLDPSAEAING
jgi:hypothetical protein